MYENMEAFFKKKQLRNLNQWILICFFQGIGELNRQCNEKKEGRKGSGKRSASTLWFLAVTVVSWNSSMRAYPVTASRGNIILLSVVTVKFLDQVMNLTSTSQARGAR